MSREIPSEQEVRSYLDDRRNWGRWGDEDGRGTINLVTAEKRLAAFRLVRTGRTVPMALPWPTQVGPGNDHPALDFFHRGDVPHGGGHAGDFIAVNTHGVTVTHLDALSHIWDEHGTYNGKNPDDVLTFHGVTFGGIEEWVGGIFTRGVMIDVVRHRGTFVTQEEPVHGWELEDIVRERGVELEPGDAVCINSGRGAWQAANPTSPYGRTPRAGGGGFQKPGLHASCLPFLRDHDVGVLCWDMMDLIPTGYSIPWTVHGAINAYGLCLLDNADTEAAAAACIEEGRDDFLFVAVPLLIPGGTASPVNPIAVF